MDRWRLAYEQTLASAKAYPNLTLIVVSAIFFGVAAEVIAFHLLKSITHKNGRWREIHFICALGGGILAIIGTSLIFAQCAVIGVRYLLVSIAALAVVYWFLRLVTSSQTSESDEKT